MQSYLDALRKYATFNGRATREQFWMWYLIQNIVILVLYILESQAFGQTDVQWVTGMYSLLTLLPGIAVTVRRLHDTGRQGAYFLAFLIPLVGFPILYLVFLTEPSRLDAVPKDPKAPEYHRGDGESSRPEGEAGLLRSGHVQGRNNKTAIQNQDPTAPAARPLQDHDETSSSGKDEIMQSREGLALNEESKAQSMDPETRRKAVEQALKLNEIRGRLQATAVDATTVIADLRYLQEIHDLSLIEPLLGSLDRMDFSRDSNTYERTIKPNLSAYLSSFDLSIIAQRLASCLTGETWTWGSLAAASYLISSRWMPLAECAQMIVSSDSLTRSNGLRLLNVTPVNADSLEPRALRELADRLPGVLPASPPSSMLDKRGRWLCCGYRHAQERRFCESCKRDWRGLSPDDPDPEAVAGRLRIIADTLESLPRE